MKDNESIVSGYNYSHSNTMAQAFKVVGVCGGVSCLSAVTLALKNIGYIDSANRLWLIQSNVNIAMYFL